MKQATALVLSLTVLMVGAINLRQGPRSVQVRPGVMVTLTCDVDQKGGTTVYWKRRESNEYLSHDRNIYMRLPADRRRRYSIVGSHAQDVFTLQIANVELADDGTYQCGYADGLGRFNVLASARLTILIAPSAESPMCFVNTISGNPKQRKVGDVVDLICKTEGGNPIPDLTWFRGEEELEENENRRFAVHRQILRPQDANMNYTCVMRGPLVTERRACTLFPMQTPPEVRIEPALISARIGSSAIFTCSMIGSNMEVRKYSWNVDKTTAQTVLSASGRMTLTHSDQVLTISDIQGEDNDMVLTCQTQTTTGELLSSTARLVIVEPTTMMTEELPEQTTTLSPTGNEDTGTRRSWQRAMRPTGYNTELPITEELDRYATTEVDVTVEMKPKVPAFLRKKTFLYTSVITGAVIVILLIVIVVIVKVVKKRRWKNVGITDPVMRKVHGNSDGYATILEMKRDNGSTYRGAATLPNLKSDRRLNLRGGSSLSLSARSTAGKSGASRLSPLYARADKVRGGHHELLAESKDNPADPQEHHDLVEHCKDSNQAGDSSAPSTLSNKDLNVEGLIYADLILNESDSPKKAPAIKGTQYASIVPQGKP
ncbi:uncharacterized protein [Diadema antillarum]|uniref:uncharacterized protein n=1 Tax=Diadema antillarum TaxID=105358 RepID=UPI003A8B6C56